MLLICPDDLQFPNGPRFEAGAVVDTDVLAAKLDHPDPAALADALVDQGWATAADAKPATIDEVVASVDGDPHAARAALDAELARSRPRKKLVALLEGLATVPDDGTDPKES